MDLSLTGQTGHGTPDELASLSAVIIDGDSIFVDNGAIHGKSRVERGIQFGAKSPDQIPDGRRVVVVWITLKRGENGGTGYHGLCASIPFSINGEAQLGYKSLPDQVNKMGAAMQGKIQLDLLTIDEKVQFAAFLKGFRNGETWSNTRPDVLDVLGE